MIKPIVIIGSGLAAYTLIREYRKLNSEHPITVITQESGDFYSKPMLSTAIAGQKSAKQLVTSSGAKMAEQFNLTLHAHATLKRIEPKHQMISVVLSDDQSIDIEYSQLVLALGADQIRISIGGDASDAIQSVNDLHDYAIFRKQLDGKKKVVILGAGLIGCEFANDLALGGYQVEVIDLADQVLSRLLPKPIAQALEQQLSSLGVLWHLGTSIQSISHDGDHLQISLRNGQSISADLVLSALGLAPRVQLAKEAGIATNRGIVVNRQLETSIQNIYSLGDCAEVEGQVLPYVMPIMQAARTLTMVLAGQNASLVYPAMPVMIKTPALPLIVSPPPIGSSGSWSIKHLDGGIEGLFHNDQSELIGFALAGSATSQRAALTKLLPPILGTS
ncbi:FAD-dependent oxidoreductase [Polynucleobacter sp. HIN6]|uniref:FAD-dependent oxidoreductase n=1 Tax=Polynucleobacter sp. HIN6 TaxID=3047865 RepID=UPI0025737C37|nr:FAD-dependent oxidoreductase [Polynucleobacter sp. HIN6]BEI36026.1 FAD-dependent oxidoreductase [Polynucleobacter sp. HIN6]